MAQKRKPVDRTEYQAEYYDSNRDQISAARKDKYHTDEEYRQRVLERNRVSRKNQRVKSRVSRAQKAPVAQGPYRVFEEGDTRYVTIGCVADALGVSAETIRLWEETGVTPPCQNRSAKGERLYSGADLLHLRALLLESGRLKEKPEVTSEDATPEVPKTDPDYVVRFSDQRVATVKLHRVSVLAALLGRTVNTVSSWEKEGKIPATPLRKPFRTQGLGVRLYTQNMMVAVKSVLSRYEKLPYADEWKEIHNEIRREWAHQHIVGVPNAFIVE